MQYSTWEKLKGRLISLDISCVNSARKSELSSCLLFIVNGTSECKFFMPTFYIDYIILLYILLLVIWLPHPFQNLARCTSLIP